MSNFPSQVMLYHPNSNLYLFVSSDTSGGDNIVEAHSSNNDDRNWFTFESTGSGTPQYSYCIFNHAINQYLFVSSDTSGGDNYIETHSTSSDTRNTFILSEVAPKMWTIYNPASTKLLFVSSDTKGGDNIVEAHSNSADTRNYFQLIQQDGTPYTEIR